MKPTKKIKITHDAFAEGYEGAFLRAVTEEGKPSTYGIFDNWYTAYAKDNDGNEYTVHWAVKENYVLNIQEEDCACEWETPYMVIDECGKDITYVYDVIIEW